MSIPQNENEGQAQHTPGPYEAGESDGALWIAGPDPLANVLADIVNREGSGDLPPTPEDWANAYLFAASADLLAACEAVAHQLEVGEASDSDGCDLTWCVRELRAAIAKARGNGGQL